MNLESAPLEMRLKQYERELGEARKYSRNSMVFASIGTLIFLYGIFTGTILLLTIGFIVMGVFIFPVMKWPKKEQELKEQISKTEEEIIQKHQRSNKHTRKCPYCAETIQVDAILCRYCGRDLSESTVENRVKSTNKAPSSVEQSALKRLEGANMEGANLVDANLEAANLKGANLVGANMESANLVGANLSRANLQYTNLIGANMVGANLIGANMDATNLIGANMRDARLNYAKYTNTTKWPEDVDPKARGAVLVERQGIG